MRNQSTMYDEADSVRVPLMTKKDVAQYFQCSMRQVELMANKGRLPKPFYLGDSSPRWRKQDIESLIERLSQDAQAKCGVEVAEQS